MKIKFVFIIMFLTFFISNEIYAQDNVTKPLQASQGQGLKKKLVANPIFYNIFAGEFVGWGIKVPADNYIFVKNTILAFANKRSSLVASDEELEDQIWEQLLLSFEAFRQGIYVEPKELEDRITKVLDGYKINFNWKQNRNAYMIWVRDNLKEPVEVFENQLRHFIQLDKLRQRVVESIKPEISEDEIRQDFRNENNIIGLELVQIEDLKRAQDFYAKMKDPGLWEIKAKDDPNFSQRLGFVAFKYLIDTWKIPSEDLYRMIKMEDNTIYPPTPIYKGYGVLRILKKKVADENDFTKVRDRYYKNAQIFKKYEGLSAWIQKLKEEAMIRQVWQVS
ncbi:MAG: hypothetical protein ABIH27_04885 [Candidatus Omnitrophota bacterium]